MGCINSARKNVNLEFGVENVYRVHATRIISCTSAIESGVLELTRKELTFAPEGRESITWALQHLRRYGCSGDIFSFEAGRRCITGPGIYAFRCQHAENIYRRFQSYVNAVITCENTLTCSNVNNRLIDGTADSYQLPNTYLEPVPLNPIQRISITHESLISPISPDFDSINFFHNWSLRNDTMQIQNRNAHQISNVYQEIPTKSDEHNNNLITIRNSDFPPQELAPNLNVDFESNQKINITERDHMYENISTKEQNKVFHTVFNEKYNHNFSRIELPVKLDDSQTLHSSEENCVSYIVLDLDQSPNSKNSRGTIKEIHDVEISFSNIPSTSDVDSGVNLFNNACDAELRCHQQNIEKITSLGYSTIDFIKTSALITSLESEIEYEGSRKTRHSSSVQKLYD